MVRPTLRQLARQAAAGARTHVPEALLPPRLRPPLGRTDFTRYCAAQLRRGHDRTVVVLAAAGHPGVQRWTERFRRDRVVVLTDTDLDRLDAALSRIGPVDLLVSLRPGAANEQAQDWRRLFFHLRHDGLYALSLAEGAVFPQVLQVAGALAAGEPATGGGPQPDPELVEATSSIELSRHWLLVRKRNRHRLKLTNESVPGVLAGREPDLRVHEPTVLPAGEFRVRSRVEHHGGHPAPRVPERLSYPPHVLRHYEGQVAVMRNRLVYSGETILPESFRHQLAVRGHNRRLIDADERFARQPRWYHPQTRLPGSYYHLDSEHAGHFGHLMGEDVARLWGWRTAKAADPQLKVLFRTRSEVQEDPTLERRIYGAFGIAEEDIVWVDHPVWVESLWAATPMLHDREPFYIHPDIAETWDRLAAGLVDPDLTTPKRVFVSRRPTYRKGNRTCRNAEAVESLFVEHGFEVVYPELLDLAEQATVFRRAEVVAGFAGSGMYNLVFARPEPTVIVLGQDEYEARTEELFSAVKGGELHYFWNPPDSHSDRRHPRRGHYSSWSFDVERHGAALTSLLAARSADR